MINYLSNSIYQKINIRLITLFSIAFIIMQALMMLKPLGLAKIESISPGVKILDARFNYSIQEAHMTLEKLGDRGRQAYVRLLITDFIYIISYVCFFIVIISSIIKHFIPSIPWVRLIMILPAISGIFDALENSIALFQINAFPDESFLLYRFSNLMIMMKFIPEFCTKLTSFGLKYRIFTAPSLYFRAIHRLR